VKNFVIALALAVPCAAQYQLPPGTSSSVPENEQQKRVSPEEAALRSAEEAITANKFDDAVKLLAPLAIATQKDDRVFYDLGFAQDALGHDAEAAAAYKSAIVLDGNDAAARVSLGLLLARGGDVAGAEVQLLAASKISGAEPALVARANRALAQMHLQGSPERARDELLAALRLSKETPEDAVMAAEIADALHDDAAAEKAYSHALQMAPGDVDTTVGYARVLSRGKKFGEAAAVLNTARTANPKDTQILAELASEQLLQGHAEQAVPLLEQMHAAEASNGAIALLLARAYTESGSPEKAEALYTALIAASPNDPVLLTEAADALIREKRSDEAEPLLQRAMEHKNGFPTKKALADAAGELAFAASTNQEPEVTLKALAVRESIEPLTAPFSFLRATAHDTLRHTREAAASYRLFLQQSAGSLPDQEWQAQQRLKILDRAK
jgi:Flp pilus assembly protein TadD